MPKTESVIAWEVEEGVDVVDSVVAGEGDHQWGAVGHMAPHQGAHQEGEILMLVGQEMVPPLEEDLQAPLWGDLHLQDPHPVGAHQRESPPMMATETGLMTEGMALHQSVVTEVMSMRDHHMTENVNALQPTQVIVDMLTSTPLHLVVIQAVTEVMAVHLQKDLTAVQTAMAAHMVAPIGEDTTLRGTMVRSDTHPLIEAMGVNGQIPMTEAVVATPVPLTEVMLQIEATHPVIGLVMAPHNLVNGRMVPQETGPILPHLIPVCFQGFLVASTCK